MKRTILYIMLLASMLASCGNSYEEQRRLSRAERLRLHVEDSLALKIAVMPTLDCLPLFVAKERCLYDTAHLDLRLHYFTAQMDCDTALARHRVEGFVSDLVRVERLRGDGVAVDCISSTGAHWQLFTNHRSRIKRLDQLGDKMVAMTRYSATDVLTDHALKGVKVSSMVFRIQVNDVNVRLAMLLNNEMDAAWMPEPQATAARLAGDRSIWDSRDRDLRLGVVAFRGDVAKDGRRQAQVKCFVDAYNRACDSINRNGVRHYADIMDKYYRINHKVLGALPRIEFKHVQKPRQSDIDFVNRNR